MRISEWSSDVCSSDLHDGAIGLAGNLAGFERQRFAAPLDGYFFHVKHGFSFARQALCRAGPLVPGSPARAGRGAIMPLFGGTGAGLRRLLFLPVLRTDKMKAAPNFGAALVRLRSAKHTSELQSIISTSYAVFCL